jgi:hypothetical protein
MEIEFKDGNAGAATGSGELPEHEIKNVKKMKPGRNWEIFMAHPPDDNQIP